MRVGSLVHYSGPSSLVSSRHLTNPHTEILFLLPRVKWNKIFYLNVCVCLHACVRVPVWNVRAYIGVDACGSQRLTAGIFPDCV